MESFCFSKIEDELHDNFASSRTNEENGASCPYIRDSNLFQQIDAYCEQNDANETSIPPLVIAGESGVGKSALLANWMAERKSKALPSRSLEYDDFIFWHAIGCSRLSIKVSHLLRRLVNSLTKHFELKEAIDLADDKLPWVLPRLLERAAKKGRVIIVIDGGLHHVCGNNEDHGFKWLPLNLPLNVRMILSATKPTEQNNLRSPISEHASQLYVKIRYTWDEMRRRKWPMVFMEALPDRRVATLVHEFPMAPCACKSDGNGEDQILNKVSHHPLMGNPFFLTCVLRGIQHAACSGYNVQQCLIEWTKSEEVMSSSELIDNMLSTFENGGSHLGSLIGHSLSLLFVARHGLHENELFDLLGRVQAQSHWKHQTKGTVVPVKLKILKLLMHKKERLIDIFRSFDTDGNGTLSHDEFYKGMERLDINVTHQEVEQLINEVDNNGDGEIDYQETLDHFEHLSRSYSHGKRKNSLFYKQSAHATDTLKEKTFLASSYKQNLISTLESIGIVCVHKGTGHILSMPFENTSLRDTVWKRCIKSKRGEAKSRKFLIEYFTTHQPSLRRCEELPWHLKKCRSWSSLKKILIDLRTLDIMFNSEELKSELFEYLRRLTEGKKPRDHRDANPQGPDDIKENASKSTGISKQTVKFDIVYEYNRAMEQWYQKSSPSSTQVSMMCEFISVVMAWFSTNMTKLTKVPPFMREHIDITHLQKIGVDRLLGRDLDERPGTCVSSAGNRQAERNERNQIQSEAFYFLNRWIWIQFPWLALQNASKICDRPCDTKDSSRSSFHCRPHSSLAEVGNDRRFWDVKKKDPENNTSPIKSTRLRDKAMATAGVSAPSATMKYMSTRMSKLTTKESRKKSFTEIPFSTTSKRSSRIKIESASPVDDSSCSSAQSHINKSKPQHFEIEPHNRRPSSRQNNQQENLGRAFSKLSELRDIHDCLIVESAGKAKHLKELQSSVAMRNVGDNQSHRNIVAGESILEQLQSRLTKICGLIGKASSVDFVYRDILVTLQSCNPSDQKRHLELEQQITLSKSQISDLHEQQGILDQEIDQVQSTIFKISSENKSIIRERQRMKPLLESLRARANEELERRKTARVTSFDPSAFARRTKLETVIARRKTKRNDKMKRHQSMISYPVSDKFVEEIVTAHPMEVLSHAAGTHDPAAIVEKIQTSELRQEDLRRRQERSEHVMKERKSTLESLHLQIEELQLADDDHQAHSTTADMDRHISVLESRLACTRKKLDTTFLVVKQVRLAIQNLESMVQSIEDIQTCNAIGGGKETSTEEETTKFVATIKALCNKISPRHTHQPGNHCAVTKRSNTGEGDCAERKIQTPGVKSKKAQNQNMRIFNREEQESRYIEVTKQIHEIEDEKFGDDDCSERTDQDADEDFDKLASYVRQSIRTNASENEQRRANLLSHAKHTNKGLVLEAVLHSASKNKSIS